MRKKNENTLQEVLQAFITDNKLKTPLNETRVKSLWEKLMGPTIATYTSQISIKKGSLHLTILSAPLRQELLFSKEKIIRIINAELQEDFIKEVIIR